MILSLDSCWKALAFRAILGLALIASFAQPSGASAQVGFEYGWQGGGPVYGPPYYQQYGPYYRFERPTYYTYRDYDVRPLRRFNGRRYMNFYRSPYYYYYEYHFFYPGYYYSPWGDVYIVPY